MSADETWPEQDLERIDKCPVCGSAVRSTLFTALRDNTFDVAPGAWTMWRCAGCESAYLDPRPNAASIGRAYSAYYTHAQPRSAISKRRGRWQTRLQLGYYNTRYGYNFPTGSSLAKLVFHFDRSWASEINYAIRHLPAPTRENATLLDIGCGNGSFLLTARDLGYVAVGLEPDEAAVRNGRLAGMDVRQGLVPDSNLPENSFDYIFLNHVFEHLHKPHEATSEILKLLRPGGARVAVAA